MLLLAACTAGPAIAPTTTAVATTTSTAAAADEPTTTSTTAETPARVGDGVDAADGLGDSLYPELGNDGYDVHHVDLHIDTRPYFDRDGPLDGVATLTIEPTVALDSFVVDAGTLVVRTVHVDGELAPYQAGPQLRIDPEKVLAPGTTVDVTITYAAPVPPNRSLRPGEGGLVPTADGLFAVGEPVGATTWMPANDHPSDKATYDVTIVAPEGLVAVTGGTASGTEPASPGIAYSYSIERPIASYLVAFVVGDLRPVDHDEGDRPWDARDWVDEDVTVSEDLLATQVEMVDFFEGLLGPYPFDTVGAVVVDQAFWGALETQTLATYAPNAVQGFILAHEVAHQWLGNSVSLADWSDIWLNEGLTTYAEWLWVDHAGERSLEDSVARGLDRSQSMYPGFGPGEPPADELFHRTVYERGALTVHALRLEVGDDAFFEILGEWVARHAYGNARTEDFIALSEEISGMELDGVFDAWLYGEVPDGF